MYKIRVHELAKEINKSSKDIMYVLKSRGIDVQSHMSTLSEETSNMVRQHYTQKSDAVKAIPKPVQEKKVEMQSLPESKDRIVKNRNPEAEKQGQNQSGQQIKSPNQSTQKQGTNAGVSSQNQGVKGDNQGRGQNQGQTGGQQGSRPNQGQTGGQQGSRPNQGQTGQQGSRPNQGQTGGQQGSRPYQGQTGGQQGSRPYQGQTGQQSQQGNRPGGGPRNNNQGYQRQGQGVRNNNQSNSQGPRNNNQGNGQYQGQRNNSQGTGQNSGPRNNSQGSGQYQGQRNNGQGNGQNQNQRNRVGNNQAQNASAGRPNQQAGTQNREQQPKTNNWNNNRNAAAGGNKNNQQNNQGRNNWQNKNNRSNGNNNGNGNFRGGRRTNNDQNKPKPVVEKEKITEIKIPELVTIKELADKMKIQPSLIVKKLFLQGRVVTLNQELEFDEATEIALEYEIIAEREEYIDVLEELLAEDEEDAKKMATRPPVVCVMGHVDHGKTSLLDAIRSSSVIDKEAGGITQHIGAYTVEPNGHRITFLDTPGHEAFTAMRLRGAMSTDIAILVVAADDGVMPQTVEAINHAKAAEVEIIVAINKIDKPSANVERVKQELMEYELVAEDWGGDTIFVPVSAHTHEGISQLLEMILLVAEVQELKANPKRKARGLVIEAELDKGRGPVATILVQKGTLKIGDFICAGQASGKIRAMNDDKGRRVKEAGPSMPVEILGLSEVPNAGEIFVATDTDKEAKAIASAFLAKNKEKLIEDTKSTRISLDDLFNQIQAGTVKELNIIVKADVQGSVEAVKQSLVKLSNEEVAVRVIHGGVGAINESDVTLAATSNAIIIGFNVRPDNTARARVELENVDLRLYRVIYNAIEDIRTAMHGMLEPIYEEKVIGHAEVRQLYKVSNIGTIAGSYVIDGKFVRSAKARLLRDNIVVYEGELSSLKRFKDDVKEVATNYECGLMLEKYNDIKEGDIVEAFVMEEVPRK